MKPFAIAIATSLGLLALGTPANAARFSWNVEYTGWWAADGGGSISGQFIANPEDALDGIISIEEMTSWFWNWTGNDVVPAFSISSKDAGASTDGFFPRFYVDGTPNQPFDFNLDPNLDQGAFTAGDYYLDLEFLRVESLLANLVSQGNPELMGTITVSDPTVVPEPATLLGLMAIAGLATTLKRQKQEA
ncbi:MAG: PEP-CTERM sorting domain-containing protein [Desertifilum sp. SIO1I2]|nr:PEP-CTERM sorting domain-containing protein [Desertifilum sp. SIO1I2]